MTTRLAILIAACALLWSLESLRPLRRNGGRRRLLPNLTLNLLVVLVNVAASFVIAKLSATGGVSWLRVAAGIAALDLATYVAHVTLHALPFGWRVHRVHHSDGEVDVTTALRQHPAETLWRAAWLLPPILLLQLPFGAVVLYQTLSSLNALAEHANVRVPRRLDRIARLLFVTPDMHKVHHSRLQAETDSNYANILSLWDRLFGTYTRRADVAAIRYGLDGFDDPSTQTLRALLRAPYRLSS